MKDAPGTWVGVRLAAALLGSSEYHVQAAVRQGLLGSRGGGKSQVVSRADVERLAAQYGGPMAVSAERVSPLGDS